MLVVGGGSIQCFVGVGVVDLRDSLRDGLRVDSTRDDAGWRVGDGLGNDARPRIDGLVVDYAHLQVATQLKVDAHLHVDTRLHQTQNVGDSLGTDGGL